MRRPGIPKIPDLTYIKSLYDDKLHAKISESSQSYILAKNRKNELPRGKTLSSHQSNTVSSRNDCGKENRGTAIP